MGRESGVNPRIPLSEPPDHPFAALALVVPICPPDKFAMCSLSKSCRTAGHHLKQLYQNHVGLLPLKLDQDILATSVPRQSIHISVVRGDWVRQSRHRAALVVSVMNCRSCRAAPLSPFFRPVSPPKTHDQDRKSIMEWILQSQAKLAAVPQSTPTHKSWHFERRQMMAKVVEVLAGDGGPRLVGLASISGSGKTTAAAEVLRSLKVLENVSDGVA